MNKVLFISRSDLPDFQSDMVFHGGRELLGDGFVDVNKVWYCYKTDKDRYWNTRVPENGKSYGGGFTLYGLLDDIEIDRSEIIPKIQSHYFDIVIYGSIHRCQDYIDLVAAHYDKNDILFVDGEDHTDIFNNLHNHGRYFKRECIRNDIFPINFGIPSHLVLDSVPEKTRDFAHIIPGDKSTYIYDNQDDYYRGYQESYFGVTTKKGGWDCLRHYEILMNGCIPWFPSLEHCPEHTMTLFPKSMIMEVMKKVENEENILTFYDEYASLLLNYTKEYLTTVQIVKKMIETL